MVYQRRPCCRFYTVLITNPYYLAFVNIYIRVIPRQINTILNSKKKRLWFWWNLVEWLKVFFLSSDFENTGRWILTKMRRPAMVKRLYLRFYGT